MRSTKTHAKKTALRKTKTRKTLERIQPAPAAGGARDWKADAERWFRYDPKRLLQPPTSIADLESRARAMLAFAAQWKVLDLQLVVNAVDDALSFLTATSKHGGSAIDLAYHCLSLKDRLDETIRELKKDGRCAEFIRQSELAKRERANRFCGTGTRGLKAKAPRNRIVIRLFDYMQERQAGWRLFVPAEEQETYKTTLHPTVQKIVSLPPLSPACALQYHRVGRALLQDATVKKHFSFHPAFEKGGEFHDIARQIKSLDGALNQAWRELARFVERERERFEKL